MQNVLHRMVAALYYSTRPSRSLLLLLLLHPSSKENLELHLICSSLPLQTQDPAK